MSRQHLVIDADDTLWENNIYFEKAFDDFCVLLQHSTLTPSEIRVLLDEIEIVNIKVHGYGATNFSRNLRQCLQKLAEWPVEQHHLDQATQCALQILDHPIHLIEGVADTLQYLADKHELILFTKGDPAEQQAKIERSGVDHLFDHAMIVKEKDITAYESLASTRRFHTERAWMIGNSPKSDINPSLAAGWNAALVPHARTWSLEQMEISNPGPGRLLMLDRFLDLQKHF